MINIKSKTITFINIIYSINIFVNAVDNNHENYELFKHNPQSIVGRRIEILWQKTTPGQDKKELIYYSGTIVYYDETKDIHIIFYDDEDFKAYNLLEKQWRFSYEERRSARLRGFKGEIDNLKEEIAKIWRNI